MIESWGGQSVCHVLSQSGELIHMIFCGPVCLKPRLYQFSCCTMFPLLYRWSLLPRLLEYCVNEGVSWDGTKDMKNPQGHRLHKVLPSAWLPAKAGSWKGKLMPNILNCFHRMLVLTRMAIVLSISNKVIGDCFLTLYWMSAIGSDMALWNSHLCPGLL